jgi:integrase/recombinase XerD
MSPTRTVPPGPRKSALRVASLPAGTVPLQGQGRLPQPPGRRTSRRALTAAELREISIDELAAWLRTQTSPKTKCPYEEKTVSLYCQAARALHAWMTAEKLDADFTACDTDMLNRFFAAYLKTHTQGGTNHPSAEPDQFIADLLDVTGGGRARTFEDIRDHAIVRVLSEGPRITEVSSMEMCDLPLNLIAQPLFRVTPLKGARRSNEGRIDHARRTDHGQVGCRLPARPSLPPPRRRPGAVARYSQPGEDEQFRHLPNVQAPLGRGWL